MLLFYRLNYAICRFIFYECDVRHNALEIAAELMEQGHIVFLTQSARFCTSLDELSMSSNTLGVRVRAAQPSYLQRVHLAHVFGGVSLLSPRYFLYMRQDHTSRRENSLSHITSPLTPPLCNACLCDIACFCMHPRNHIVVVDQGNSNGGKTLQYNAPELAIVAQRLAPVAQCNRHRPGCT
ncbi:hypothetical protein P692DRAFT_20918067 [Suillus brevipes Sb2]|nr:hypothetical protein P692DRAFT_20918067 [Suillus brevipes Sb2]